MPTKARYLLAALLLLVAVAGGAWFFGQAVQPVQREPLTATVLPEPRPLPDFSLHDENGNPLTPAQLQGDWTLLFFGFTHCPDICPATLQQLAVAVGRLEEQGVTPVPRILFVSVDPQRDDSEALREYTANFGSAVLGATGDPEALTALAAPLGIAFGIAAETGQELQASGADIRDPGDEMPAAVDGGRDTTGTGYLVDHSTAVLLVNPRAQWHAVFSTPHRIATFVNDLPRIMEPR